jgi:hypothetical protein
MRGGYHRPRATSSRPSNGSTIAWTLLHLRPSEVEYLDNPNARGTWAIIINWTDHDPRRARIRPVSSIRPRRSTTSPTLPMDCPPDQARAFFEKAVKGAAHMPEAHYAARSRETLEREAQAEKNSAGRARAGARILDANKANPDMAESLGVGTVVSSFGGIEKPTPSASETELSLSACSKRSEEGRTARRRCVSSRARSGGNR